jgi:hypothetical protein
VQGLRQTYQRLKKSSWTHPTWVLWNLVSVYLEIVLVSVQDWCKVCVKHTRGSKVILDASNDLSDEAQVEARISPFGGSANLEAC